MSASVDTQRGAGLIRAENLSIAYGSGPHVTQVLHEVTLALAPGTITGLAGESGSGKSTLALALMGYRPSGQQVLSGRVDLDGSRVTGSSVRALHKLWGARLAYMPQDTSTSLNPALTIGAHFVEVLRRRGGRRTAAQRAAGWMGRVGIPEPRLALRRYPHQFSGGQQQRIALALALCLEPEVLILDEPTTGLDVVTQAQVNRLIVALARDTGVAALYVSHNLALLATVCDDLAIMYAGQIVEHGPVREVYRAPRHPYTSALISAVPSISASAPPRGIPGLARTSAATGECGFLDRCPLRVDGCASPIPLVEVSDGHVARCIRTAEVPAPGVQAARTAADREPGDPSVLITVTELTCQFQRRGGGAALRAVDGVSVTVTAGRTLGIAGESGSGKSTLLKAMAGLVRPTEGRMSFRGTDLHGLAAGRPLAVRKAIQIVFQNPDATLNPRHTIGQSMERPLRLFAPRTGRTERHRLIVEMMQQVQLSPVLLERYPRDLSGGQRQRVAIARSLLAEPEVLLCDEVTSALDVSVQASIIELLIGLRDQRRLALVFVTHDLGVLRSIADDAVIMQNGQVRETGPVAGVLAHPTDPYTVRLIDAVPHPETDLPAAPHHGTLHEPATES